MRAFIAIDLPTQIKQALAKLQDKLKTCGADVKWVEETNLHLTLKFLGEVSEEKIEAVKGVVAAVAQNYPVFKLSIGSSGAFPSPRSARVIWAGIDAGARPAKEIAKILEEKLQKIGFPKEARAFSCHITLGRARSGKGRRELAQALENLRDYFSGRELNFTAGKITLFKSTLTPSGPHYEATCETSLKTTCSSRLV